MTSKRSWRMFAVAMLACIMMIVVATVHVGSRWEPDEIEPVAVGEWMEFEGFKVRIAEVEIADTLVTTTGEKTSSPVPGMKLMRFRYEVEVDENFYDSIEGPICSLTVINHDGIEMDERSLETFPGPINTSCFAGEDLDPEFGDLWAFQGQVVYNVTPDPLNTFMIQVRLYDDLNGVVAYTDL